MVPASPFAPFRHRAFFWLWLGVVVASIGSWGQLEAYEQLSREIGQTPADVALAWLLHQPVVSAAIVGPRTADQLTRSLRAPEIALTEETLRRLNDIWPGAGGEAPEAYAW